MKKVLLMTLLLLFAIPGLAQRGFIQDHIRYQLFNSEEEVPYAIVWGAELTEKTDLVIPATVSYEGVEYTVTEIARSAFSKCENLTSIEIPNSVTKIGDLAFWYCHLKSVIIGNSEIDISHSKTFIGKSAFNGSWLNSIFIGNCVAAIGEDAFSDCINLEKVDFASIESLCSIKFENHLSNPLSKGHNLYIGGNLVTELVIPNTITKIGNNIFYECTGLTSVEIPNSVTEIGVNAFAGCNSLTSIKFPNSLTIIKWAAFYECSGLTFVEFPNSITEIGPAAFYGCRAINEINYNTSDSISVGNKDIFSDEVYIFATLNVAKGTLERVKATSPWMYFTNIQEKESLGIDTIVGDFNPNLPVEYYDIHGVKISDTDNGLAPGIYIIRQGLVSKKVIVR